ncbi:hypothetical protein SELMODRAFT_426643 [Selaginella moellendorffii]|uniref:Aspartic peptidase DDI1-type domain-containing protein n=1 Tax=Selaginella moellendorffii TaxID=88036 RepID=D8SX13_SELML|nr:hypothetical protein SELMODRAFT_426643 [Selaginella moellendorffii]
MADYVICFKHHWKACLTQNLIEDKKLIISAFIQSLKPMIQHKVAKRQHTACTNAFDHAKELERECLQDLVVPVSTEDDPPPTCATACSVPAVSVEEKLPPMIVKALDKLVTYKQLIQQQQQQQDKFIEELRSSQLLEAFAKHQTSPSTPVQGLPQSVQILDLKSSPDPGAFVTNVTIGGCNAGKGLLDSGSLKNVISSHLVKALYPSEKTTVLLKTFVNHTVVPMGVCQDILIQTDGISACADFIVVNF